MIVFACPNHTHVDFPDHNINLGRDQSERKEKVSQPWRHCRRLCMIDVCHGIISLGHQQDPMARLYSGNNDIVVLVTLTTRTRVDLASSAHQVPPPVAAGMVVPLWTHTFLSISINERNRNKSKYMLFLNTTSTRQKQFSIKCHQVRIRQNIF